MTPLQSRGKNTKTDKQCVASDKNIRKERQKQQAVSRKRLRGSTEGTAAGRNKAIKRAKAMSITSKTLLPLLERRE